MDQQALFALGYGLYVVSARRGEKLNAQISNALMQVTASPAQVALANNKEEYTHQMIRDTKRFCVSVLGTTAPLPFIGHFGFQTGAEVDKFAEIDHKLTQAGLPYPVEHVLAVMDFKVIDEVDVATHRMFIGELVESFMVTPGVPMTYAYYQEHLRGRTPPTAPTAGAVKIDKGEESESPGEPTASAEVDAGPEYRCGVCGYVYNPAIGRPADGIDAGTSFADLPDDWRCPVCGADKEVFEPED